MKTGFLLQTPWGLHFGAWGIILGGQSGLAVAVLAILVCLVVILGAHFMVLGVKMGAWAVMAVFGGKWPFWVSDHGYHHYYQVQGHCCQEYDHADLGMPILTSSTSGIGQL